ncbi:MAG: DoxX family protein [Verrucomicrobia bacterium]|nr:MAG: DoxX family protein [Verrucomicrobiota bacterium]
MGGLAQTEMNKTPNVQLATPNTERTEDSTLAVGRSALDVWRLLWRILDFVVAGIFIYAGSIKALDPVQFANDIDNYKILPWPISVALAFYLPWLEIFCGLALIVRYFYRGALSILMALILVFTLATTAAKVRGLDITCGCFGHASQHWSFPAHLATNLAIVLWVSNRLTKSLQDRRSAWGS